VRRLHVLPPAVIVSIVVAGAILRAEGTHQRPVFRSEAEAVLVPVSVMDGNRPVAGLTTDDFELLDNGVPQAVSSTDVESLPIDVTLVVDTSGSVDRRARTQFERAMQDIALSLRPNDQVRLIGFGTRVSDAAGFQPGGAPLPLAGLTVGGGTAFYDAMAAALMGLRPSERPQLVVGFSDGLDNMSFADASTVTALAGRVSAALYLLLARRDAPKYLRGIAPWTGQPDTKALHEAADRTGGDVFEHRINDALPALFQRVVDDFRTKYLLRYSPEGVAARGWHEITVKVKGKKYTVRARKGYEGD